MTATTYVHVNFTALSIINRIVCGLLLFSGYNQQVTMIYVPEYWSEMHFWILSKASLVAFVHQGSSFPCWLYKRPAESKACWVVIIYLKFLLYLNRIDYPRTVSSWAATMPNAPYWRYAGLRGSLSSGVFMLLTQKKIHRLMQSMSKLDTPFHLIPFLPLLLKPTIVLSSSTRMNSCEVWSVHSASSIVNRAYPWQILTDVLSTI